MKRRILVGLAALAGMTLAVAAHRQAGQAGEASAPMQRLLVWRLQRGAPPTPPGVVTARRGQPLPALPVHDLQGRPVDAATLHAGQDRTLVLWATWCGPCVREWPALVKHARSGRSPRLLVIALDDPAAVQAFLARHPAPFPVLVDPPGPRDIGVRLGNPRGLLPFRVDVAHDQTVTTFRLGPFVSLPAVQPRF